MKTLDSVGDFASGELALLSSPATNPERDDEDLDVGVYCEFEPVLGPVNELGLILVGVLFLDLTPTTTLTTKRTTTTTITAKTT